MVEQGPVIHFIFRPLRHANLPEGWAQKSQPALMTLGTFSIILSGVLLNSVAQLLLKAGARAIGSVSLTSSASLMSAVLGAATQPWIALGLVCYFVSAGLWIVALTRVDVTVAYPMLSLGYVIAAVLAWQIFGEQLTAMRLFGIFIILVGVLVLARG